jgi:hypothetical protein
MDDPFPNLSVKIFLFWLLLNYLLKVDKFSDFYFVSRVYLNLVSLGNNASLPTVILGHHKTIQRMSEVMRESHDVF